MSTPSRQSASKGEQPPAPSKGVRIARANRAKCNDLGNEDRAALMGKALNLIYGTHGSEVPARRC